VQQRVLGNTEKSLPAIGLGCMGLSEFYGPPTEQSAAIKLLREAIELTDDEQATLDRLADRVKGNRYDERGMSIING